MEVVMFEIITYETISGKNKIIEYITSLRIKSDKSKNERIKLNKIMQYIDIIRVKGSSIGEPVVKHIDGDIWELRPLRDRIFYACIQDSKIILLHVFTKKTQKTPPKELEQAKKNLQDWLKRN
jgi:phage-related protein